MERRGPEWAASFNDGETLEFLEACARQCREPADVLRQLVNLYVESDGAIVRQPENLDDTLGAFLDWCLDCPKLPPDVRTKPRRIA